MKPIYIFFCVIGVLIGVAGSQMFSGPANRVETSSVRTAKERREHLRVERQQRAEQRQLDAVLFPPAPMLSTTEPGEVAVEIIEKLRVLKNDDSRIFQRRIIHYFESLLELGPASVPAMIAFLNEVNDVIFFDREHYKQISIVGTFQIHPSSGLVGLYGLKGEKPDPIYYRSNKRLPSLKGIVPWAFVPKSMRLGIVETLVMMGGDEARAGLVVALNTTRDGFEVAMLDVCFRMMETPNQKELVTNVIHKILNEFPDYPQTNFEQSSREYLFTLLVKYNDHRYVPVAKDRIVDEATGRMNPNSVEYLISTLGPDALTILGPYYFGNLLSNEWDRRGLRNKMLPFLGHHPIAADVFRRAMGEVGKGESKLEKADFLATLWSSRELRAVRNADYKQVMKNRIKIYSELKRFPPAAYHELVDSSFNTTISKMQKEMRDILDREFFVTSGGVVLLIEETRTETQ